MCRSIHTLYHLEPPATEVEISEAAVQYIRKVSGYVKPSRKNEAAFKAAVDEIAAVTSRLLGSLQTDAPIRDRQMVSRKSRSVNP